MIDIEFLRNHHVAGLEFMDFQHSSFIEELTQAFAGEIEDGVLQDEPSALMPLIQKYTGLQKLKLELSDVGNLAVDAGYINPYNVFNIQHIEQYLTRSQSTFGRWFENNKGMILKGTIDMRTGKVGGDYADLPFTLYINRHVGSVFNEKALAKMGGDIASALAQTLVHELGHIVGGLLMVHQEVYDNLLVQSAIHFLSKSENKESRVAILRNARQELDDKSKDDPALADKLAEANNPEEYVLYFSKMRENRNSRRALSLGVPRMNSEVIADAYVIRMGGNHTFLAALASLYIQSRKEARLINAIMSFGFAVSAVINGIFSGGAAILVGIAGFATMSMIQYSLNLLPGIYNTPYRRLVNVQQELIAQLKNSKDLPAAVQRKMVQDLDQARKIIEAEKPLLEDSAFQRILLWLTNGADAKYINIEHYTQMIANHDVNVVSAKLMSL